MDGPSGTGKLAVITFRGKTLVGSSNLTLSDVILTDIDGFVQPNTAVNGSIAVKPFVIKLVPASTEIYIIDPKFTVDVVAECAYDLGSFEFDLDYDQTIAKADAVRGWRLHQRPPADLRDRAEHRQHGRLPGLRADLLRIATRGQTATAFWRTSTSRLRR